jgi:hypothetical protein
MQKHHSEPVTQQQDLALLLNLEGRTNARSNDF